MKVSIGIQTDICEMLSTSSSCTTSRSSSETDLLAAWEDLLGWSENAAAARKMQEEMIILKHMLSRLGNKASYEQLDTEPAIQIAIEALKSEKTQLQTYRTNMLRLNASVHSWLTKQEHRLQKALAEQETKVNSNEHEQSEQTQGNAKERAVEEQSMVDSNGNQLIAVNTNSTTTTTTAASTTTTDAGTGTATATATTTTITIATTAGGVSGEKVWDLHTLMSSENEFHKHLKDEVSDMYSVWDEADARINTQLEVLTNSLIAWRQLECGLSEFQQALGQDRGTLKGLEGALDRGQATPVELAQNVKVVAKLLSERVNVSQEQLTAVQEHLDPNHVLHITKFTASNGSLSDSGISDGGGTSDGGLSERERRLGVLRRLAKQLESALAPGSEAMKSIAARMESAEAELKNLQNTCRDLIVRTAASHQSKKQQQQQELAHLEAEKQREQDEAKAAAAAADAAAAVTAPAATKTGNGYLKTNGHAGGKKTNQSPEQTPSNQTPSPTKRKNKRKQRKHSTGSAAEETVLGLESQSESISSNQKAASQALAKSLKATGTPDSGDPYDDPSINSDLEASDEDGKKKGWAWRIAKAAVPMQLALFTIFCAACFMQPNCCDNLNNLSMSFTPQLRYIRGPPPI